MVRGARGWLPTRAVDWAPTLLLLLLALPLPVLRHLDVGVLLRAPDDGLPAPVVALLAAGQAVPLAWRRRRAATVTAMVGGAFLVDQWIGVPANATQFAGIVALYAVAAHQPVRRILRVFAAAFGALAVVAVAAIAVNLPGDASAASLGAGIVLFVGLPLAVGLVTRSGPAPDRPAPDRPAPDRPAPGAPTGVLPVARPTDHSGTTPVPAVLDRLTRREREVLGLLLKGYSNPEIAEALFVSRNTARTHVGHILAKLELPDRTQVLLYAQRHGLAADRVPSPGDAQP